MGGVSGVTWGKPLYNSKVFFTKYLVLLGKESLNNFVLNLGGSYCTCSWVVLTQ